MQPLTEREREVLEAASAGLTVRQIGIRLQMAEATAAFHLKRIAKKLGTHSRFEACEWWRANRTTCPHCGERL